MEKDIVAMSQRERQRFHLLEMAIGGKITLKDAGKRMGVSYRHAKRLKKKLVTEGGKGSYVWRGILQSQSQGLQLSHSSPPSIPPTMERCGWGPKHNSWCVEYVWNSKVSDVGNVAPQVLCMQEYLSKQYGLS